jgi:putative hydrolase of the HAD superfamily
MSAPASTSVAVSALLFDFGGTLDSDGVAWKDRFFHVWRKEVGGVARERFDAAFYAADDSLAGSVAPELTLTETVERLARGLAFRLGEGEGDPAARAASRFSRESLETLSGRGKLLARLASRYRLGIVSNFYGNLAAACAEAGIERNFSVLVDSTDIGAGKPDAKIFQAALDRLRVRPDETVFIGDSMARDMAGARALGMRHVLLRAPALADGRKGEGEGEDEGGDEDRGLSRSDSPFLCCPEDRVIRRLDDLEEALA